MIFTTRRNQDLRNRIVALDIHSYEFAESLGVHKATLCNWLNLPPDNPRVDAIRRKLNELEQEKEGV